MVIAILGYMASGKDLVANHLEKKGFTHISLSDILRQKAKEQNVALNRDSLQRFGTEIKQKHGEDFLAKIALKKIKKNTVITSIRHPKELFCLQKLANFHLIEITAPIKKRYLWAKERARIGDETTLAKFIAQEHRERTQTGGQQLDKVRKYCKIHIKNNGTKEELLQKIDEFIQNLK